jgi:hypothetical protein
VDGRFIVVVVLGAKEHHLRSGIDDNRGSRRLDQIETFNVSMELTKTRSVL